jgi:PTS system galactitol-specific IIA component
VLDWQCEEWEQVLRHFAWRAIDKGFARAGFGDALIQRERAIPTGLPLQIPLAIPHAYPEYIFHSGVGIALLDPPVNFHEMGKNNGSFLSVRLVILMLTAKGISCNKELSTIIRMFDNAEWYENFSKVTRAEELANAYHALFNKTKLSMSSQMRATINLEIQNLC